MNWVNFSYSVPMQKNGCDCGLYVCQDVLDTLKIREQIISKNDLSIMMKGPISRIIIILNFNQTVINQFRRQLLKLLDNLYQAYANGKIFRRTRSRKESSAAATTLKSKLAVKRTRQ
jgi:hypothetical protein